MPSTAQHAIRQGKVLARNMMALVDGKALKPFRFKTLGLLAAIGRRTGVARILGFHFSGFLAWFLWRGIYLAKLPRLEKKVRVALDWTLDLFFSKDLVQFHTNPTALVEMAARLKAAQGAGTNVSPGHTLADTGHDGGEGQVAAATTK